MKENLQKTDSERKCAELNEIIERKNTELEILNNIETALTHYALAE